MAARDRANYASTAVRRRQNQKGGPGSSPGPDFVAATFGLAKRVAHHGGRDIHVPRAMDYAPEGSEPCGNRHVQGDENGGRRATEARCSARSATRNRG